jgi:subtilase family serine protease
LGRPLPGSTPITLTVALLPRQAGTLTEFDGAVIDPLDPLYHHFLTESEFEARFAPSPANTSAVAEYFLAHGAQSVTPTPDGLGLRVLTTAGVVDSALDTSLRELPARGSSPDYVANGPPRLPSSVARMVLGVGGLTDEENAELSLGVRAGPLHPTVPRAGPSQFVTVFGSTQQLFFGSDLAQAYGDSQLFPSPSTPLGRFANGTAVATILFSGYNDTENLNLPPFDPVVVSQYFNDTFGPDWPFHNVTGVPVTLDGVEPPAPGPVGGLGDDTLAQSESALDLEMAGSMAPGADLYTFYFASSLYESSNVPASSLADDFATTLSNVLSYNYSTQRLASVSNSYGLGDLNDSLWDVELAHAAALGVTVVAATGDQANAPDSVSGRSFGPNPLWPATAAFDTSGVVAVGGTSPTLSGVPTSVFNPSQPLNVSFDPNVTGVASESAWYDTSQGIGQYAGTEGGVSTVYAEPSWQYDSAAQPTIVNATVTEQLSQLGRAVPDLALPASAIVAYTLNNSTGTYFEILEGTSAAAPMFAGMVAEVAAVTGSDLGYLDPWLYRLGSLEEASPSMAGEYPLSEVTEGSNYLFSAGPGWDPLTGWGSVYPARLPLALASSIVNGFNYTGPTPGLPPPVPNLLQASPPSASIGVWVVLIAVAVALAIALYATVRTESPTGMPPPPGVYGGSSYHPAAPPQHPRCARCGRDRAPWYAVCPWCGAR